MGVILMFNAEDYVERNVLSTTEVSEILKVSRQRLSALVKEGTLTPVKKMPQVMLFLRQDIENYLVRKKMGTETYSKRRNIPIFDHSGITQKSVSFYEKHINELNGIDSLFSYFVSLDAAIAGFYSIDIEYPNGLAEIEIPHLVIRDIVGKELWLGGCNCGYGGEGPHGTFSILKNLRDSGNLKLKYTDEELEKLVYNQVIYIFSTDDGAETNFRMSDINEFQSDFAKPYYFRDHLVLLQCQTSWVYQDKNPIGLIEQYNAFIPDPVEVIVFPTIEAAKENGYVGPNKFSRKDDVYRIIIKDSSGRELWLCPYIDDNESVYKQNVVLDILKSCRFNFQFDKAPLKIQDWLRRALIIVSPDRNKTLKPIIFAKDIQDKK